MSEEVREIEPSNWTRAERETVRAARDPILRQMLAEERIEARQVDAALLNRLFGYLRPHRGLAAMSVVLAFVEAGLMTLPPFVVGYAIDRVSGDAPSGGRWMARALDSGLVRALGAEPGAARQIWYFAAVAALLWLVRWGVAIYTTYLVQRLGQLVVHDLRVDVFRHITAMDMSWLNRNPVGRLVNRTTFDVQNLSELFSDAFAQSMRDLIFICVLMTVMLSLDVPLALILICAFPVLVAAALIYRHLARPALRTNSAVGSRMNAWLAENLAGMRENHLYRREERRRAEFRALTDAHQASITHVVSAWGLVRPALLLTSGVATSVVLMVGFDRAVAGAVSVGVLLTFLQYTTRLWIPVRNLAEKFNLIQTALTSGERIMDVLDARTEMEDDPQADSQLRVTRGEVRFDDVTFRYPGTQAVVLDGISFSAARGEMVALVGDTGAGKSTIAHLVSRFWDPASGIVFVDGEDVRRYRLSALRSGIAIVPQDVVIFAGSIRENVTLGATVPDERVMECLEAACAGEIVRRLPGGLDHVMAEAGRTLSTGERQLIAFARALVANPPLLILDEATANVDTETESLIQEALGRLVRGRTSLVIAHRLSTVREAAQILVLRNGRIVERGRHEELLERGGEYARLVRLHMGSHGREAAPPGS